MQSVGFLEVNFHDDTAYAKSVANNLAVSTSNLN